MMADLPTYRERVPLVGKMVDKAFNGDANDDDTQIDFVLITSKRDGDNRVTSMLTNFTELHEVISMLLTAMAESGGKFKPMSADDQPMGHA